MTSIKTIRPGLMVCLKTSVKGNSRYQKKIIEDAHLTSKGTEEAEWATRRVVEDPVEHKAAKKARSKVCSTIRSVCIDSSFGMLCLEEKRADLDRAIEEAHGFADEFNRTAKLTTVEVYVLLGRVAADDVEAARAINSEVRALLEAMETSIKNMDVKRIRDAAARAKKLGSMLSNDAADRVKDAVEAARDAAKKIVKAGEEAVQEVDLIALRKVTEIRTAFLELDDDEQGVQAPAAVGRAVEVAGEEEPEEIGADDAEVYQANLEAQSDEEGEDEEENEDPTPRAPVRKHRVVPVETE